ncbi:hypothetical protein C5613_24495 [Rhodococcus opacus]|uniref:Uncharacterized protein n=1 Tax=Rhodococcus opacus TaxID=37919 RepID=A0A2S8J527_RHOOP|nr:hypothetical protein C5613_24495 [Rhodococcus opacus]
MPAPRTRRRSAGLPSEPVKATSRSRTWRIRRPHRSPATLENETADVMPVTFERYPSVTFVVSLPSIAHRLSPR